MIPGLSIQALLTVHVAVSLIGIATGLVAMPALAQTAPEQSAQVEEIVVTGSRIARPDLTSTSPVAAVGEKELQQSGVVNTENLLNTLPQAVPGITSNVNNGSNGTATVNLRGLSPSRTLVLLNGQRLANTPIGVAAVDANLLPSAAIGRVEVLKDGAAATYGSDAIGGVVNFITNKQLEGLVVSGDYRFIDGSDGDYNFSVSAGKVWDRFDVFVSAGYQFKADLPVIERDWATREFNENPEATWSTGSSPFSFLPVAANFTPTGARRASPPKTASSIAPSRGSSGRSFIPESKVSRSFMESRFQGFVLLIRQSAHDPSKNNWATSRGGDAARVFRSTPPFAWSNS